MLYLIGFFLLFIIILIVITLVVFKKSKPKSCEVAPKTVSNPRSLDELVKTVKTQKEELSKIEEALSVMCQQFPFPENENEANKHFEFVYFFAKNPLSSAKLIVKMQKDLTSVNPRYAKQIEEFQMRGVEARK